MYGIQPTTSESRSRGIIYTQQWTLVYVLSI